MKRSSCKSYESLVANPDGLDVTVRSNGLRSLITELSSTVTAAQKRSAAS